MAMKKIALFAFFILSVVPASHAQVPVSGVGYFQPGYAYRHMLNPAFVPMYGYVGIPVAGNADFRLGSNMGLADFLYPMPDGSLGTFMHPEVDADAFLKRMHRRNYIGMDFNSMLLSGAWFSGKSFWNVHAAVRGIFQMGLPYELFEFAKRGMYRNPTRYKMEDIEMAFKSYIELAVGYARPVTDEITVGGKFKFLLGLVEAELRMDKVDASMGDDVWKLNSTADFRIFGRLLECDWPQDESLPAFSFGDVGLSGFGAAVDVGGEYRPSFLPGLRFSLSLLDLGFIGYPRNSIQQYSASGETDFDGFEDLGPDVDWRGQLQDAADGLLSLADFEEAAVDKSMARMINPSLNIGAEYAVWNNRFSVGLLNTTTFYHSYTENELSLIANLRPVRWFSFSLAYSFFGLANGLGWALNFTPDVGLNVFIASNYTPLEVNPQFIPLRRAHLDFQFGMVVPLTRNRPQVSGRDPMNVNIYPYGPSASRQSANKVKNKRNIKKIKL